MKALISLLLEEQSDLGLHCLTRQFVPLGAPMEAVFFDS